MKTEWTESHDDDFATAVKYMAEDISNGDSFQWALEHHAELFQIDRQALCHEWNLRKNDLRGCR